MGLIAHTNTGAGAPALIFIHAFGCDRTDWDAQLAHFAPDHQCISVDLGGHGATPARPDHIRVETHGADIIDLMDAYEIQEAVVIGNSLGCRVTLDISTRVPDRIKALVLVDGSRLSPVGDDVHAALGEGASPDTYPDVARGMFAKMFSPGFDPSKKAVMTERATKVPPEMGMALLTDIGRHDMQEMERLLAAIEVPVLALQSTYITPDGARHALAKGQSSPYLELLAQTLAKLSVEIIPNCGHYPQIEWPAETNTAIAAFLRQQL